jgi:hypothetical protein
MSMAQSMRNVAATVQLRMPLSAADISRSEGETYRHPSNSRTMVDAFIFLESCALKMAGSGATRMTELNKTCSAPMMMHDLLARRLHLPGGWHLLIHLLHDQMYQPPIITMIT